MKGINNYSFSKDVLKQSAGNFKVWVKNRYKDLKADEVNALVDKYYGKDGNGSGIKKESKPASK